VDCKALKLFPISAVDHYQLFLMLTLSDSSQVLSEKDPAS